MLLNTFIFRLLSFNPFIGACSVAPRLRATSGGVEE